MIPQVTEQGFFFFFLENVALEENIFILFSFFTFSDTIAHYSLYTDFRNQVIENKAKT